ncbi:HNH endonuclease signature motif containing protein [Paenibacillus agilis]|uniref:HNH endonuclease n=1 Tax=Paenibacillus agilis TaxID=3020863 RepID=A0A559J1H6_9BACL|nr:HNH endonuclease signature motif containing protein [Paenibacillus agilis]TVX93735.1 HNH endonuclease [Paenibacillus agilis]
MKLKKLLLSFLTIALLFTLVIPSSLATAQETSQTQVYSTENGSSYTVASSENGTEIVIPIYVIYDEETQQGYQLTESEYQQRKSSLSPMTVSVIRYQVAISANNGILTYGYTIKTLAGPIPTTAKIHVASLVSSTTRYGLYSQWGSADFNLIGSDFVLGTGKTKQDNMYNTYYWKFRINSSTTWASGRVDLSDETTDAFLLNKKGVLYPKYSDPQSGIALIEPRADMVPNPRTPSSTYRTNFMKHYNTSFGNPTYFIWDDVQVHHMIPVRFNGSDAMSNLIPLWKPGVQPQNGILSHSVLNSWWANYY